MVTYINEFRSYIVGEIDLEAINEIKITPNKYSPAFPNSFNGKCIIEVYGNEGENIPHFHITSIDKKFSCCVQLFDNRFFTHGKHTSILHKKDWEVLDSWLRLSNSKNLDNTNWEYAKFIWTRLYKRDEFKDKEQPDYTMIKPYKEK